MKKTQIFMVLVVLVGGFAFMGTASGMQDYSEEQLNTDDGGENPPIVCPHTECPPPVEPPEPEPPVVPLPPVEPPEPEPPVEPPEPDPPIVCPHTECSPPVEPPEIEPLEKE